MTPPNNKRISKGYSLTGELHEAIEKKSQKLGQSRSSLVEKGMRKILRMKQV